MREFVKCFLLAVSWDKVSEKNQDMYLCFCDPFAGPVLGIRVLPLPSFVQLLGLPALAQYLLQTLLTNLLLEDKNHGRREEALMDPSQLQLLAQWEMS